MEHCFDWEKIEEYYVADKIGQHPVLHKIHIEKFENDERYDFAGFTFHSFTQYPVIPISVKGAPAVGTQIINENFAFGLVKQATEGKVISELITEPRDPRSRRP